MDQYTTGALGLITGIMRSMSEQDQRVTLSVLCQKFAGEKTQMCGYCMTAYELAEEAAECADRCSGRQRLVTTQTETRRSSED